MAATEGVAIVTGSAQGIGRAIALRLADDGYDMVVNDIDKNAANLESVVEEISKKGRRVISVFADVSKEDDVRTLVDRAVMEFGGLNVVSGKFSTLLSSCYS